MPSTHCSYKIIRRRENYRVDKENGCRIDFPDSDNTRPLVGCRPLRPDGTIRVGDIVGVILENTSPTNYSFTTTSTLLTKTKLDSLQGKTSGSHYIREEHFFQIVKIHGHKSKYDVLRVFVGGNEENDDPSSANASVIRKAGSHSFHTYLEIDCVKDCTPYAFLYDFFVEKKEHSQIQSKPPPSSSTSLITSTVVDGKHCGTNTEQIHDIQAIIESNVGGRDWDTISNYRLRKFIEELQDINTFQSHFDETSFKKLKPYDDWSKVLIDVFDIDDEENQETISLIQEFSSLLQKHKDCLISLLGQDRYDALGTYELIRDNILQRYEDCKRIASTIADCCKCYIPVYHNLDLSAKLVSPPAIIHNIKTLKASQIYRIFETDWRHCLQRTAVVSDWSGRKLPESIRDDFQSGNIVRVYFSEWLTTEEEEEVKTKKRYKDQRVIYFRLLHKVSDRVFLAQLMNMYMSEYDDIVLQIHSDAVTEVPLTWEGNENLNAKYGDMVKEVTEGFAMTGLGAAVAATSTEPNADTDINEVITENANNCIGLSYIIGSLFRFG